MRKLSDNERVILCAALVSEQGKVSLVRLLEECIRRFPREFSWRGTKYPDTAKLEKRAWSCRTDRGWLIGTPSDGFYVLTGAGIAAALEVARRIGIALPDDALGKWSKDILGDIKDSAAFRSFLDNKDVTLHEVAVSVGLPPEATRRQVKYALRTVLGEAKRARIQPIVSFVAYCEEKLNLKNDPGK
ncbi:MAG: hypothetical protein KatS3mg015_0898 [Fimbriimonadales bacterium]|nr:MAG: hypothetical protein KatS3mg015_0898 [Fimbriimonadales bacterium]